MTARFEDDGTRSRRVGLVCILATAIGWGLNWSTIKLILRDWPPLFSRGTAGLAAALGLAAYAVVRGEPLAVPSNLFGRLTLASALNVFAWMGLSTMAMVWLSVAEGTLIVYTMPIWATLLAWPLRGMRPTPRDLLALALGLAGIAVLLAGSGVAMTGDKLPGLLLALTAGVLFALGTVIGASAIPLPPVALTAWQVGLSSIPMIVAGIVFEHPHFGALRPAGWASMAYMAIIPMGLCYLTWFEASRRLPPATAATGTLLVPLIGIVSAAPIVGEPIGLREIAALCLTLGGVAIAVRQPR